MATARKSFEAILLDRSWVSAQDLDKARQRKKPGQELADVLVEMGALEPQRLARALAQEYRLPFQAHIDENSLDSKLVSKVPINYAKKNRLLPLSSIVNERKAHNLAFMMSLPLSWFSRWAERRLAAGGVKGGALV